MRSALRVSEPRTPLRSPSTGAERGGRGLDDYNTQWTSRRCVRRETQHAICTARLCCLVLLYVLPVLELREEAGVWMTTTHSGPQEDV